MTLRLATKLVIMWTLVAATEAILGGCAASKEEPVTSSLDMAEYRKMLERQRNQQAALEDTETKTPEMTPEEHERAGDEEAQRRNFSMAGLHYTKALNADPDRNTVRLKLGQMVLQQAMFDAAVTQFQDLLKRDPTSAPAYQ